MIEVEAEPESLFGCVAGTFLEVLASSGFASTLGDQSKFMFHSPSNAQTINDNMHIIVLAKRNVHFYN